MLETMNIPCEYFNFFLFLIIRELFSKNEYVLANINEELPSYHQVHFLLLIAIPCILRVDPYFHISLGFLKYLPVLND